MNEDLKKEHIKNIIEDQKKSLDSWIDYLSSEDAKFYPTWAKYWAFQGMLTIGTYDNKNAIYKKRTKDTVAPFVELNREVLAKCIDLIINVVENNKIENEDLTEVVTKENFQKLYTIYLNKFKEINFDKTSVDGIWIKYEQGDNFWPLYNSLQGYGTGWCTAGQDTCKKQIKDGDFYVYYTKDKNNEYKVPRIAIRMDGRSKIGEIRGVAEGQNIESHLEEVLEEKLKEFPDKEKYKKRVLDTKTITKIYEKYENNIELTKEDLKFIYEVEGKVEGFGYETDPRIEEIIENRDNKKDYANIYNISEEEVALTASEYLKNPERYKVLLGDLNLSFLTGTKGLVLPEIISGDLDLSNLDSAEGLVLPQSIGGNLNLSRLTSTEGLVLPQSIGEGLNLSSLTSAEGLVLPQSIGGSLNLSRLTSTEGLVLPQSIGEGLNLSSLTSAEGLILPQSMGGSLLLSSLTSAEGLILPQSIDEYLDLKSLTSTEGLVLPESIGGDLFLGSLTSAEGLVLQESIGGDLYLDGLTSAEGLVLPENIGGDLFLDSLTSTEGLVLPENFNLDNLYCRDEVKQELMNSKGKSM